MPVMSRFGNGAVRSFGQRGAVSPTDPYFKYVSFLLGTTATNGAQNNTFSDSSANNFTITRFGNTTQGSLSPYGPDWSNYFNGSSYITMASGTAAGTGNFTIEGWFNVSSYSTGPGLYDARPSSTNGAYPAVFVDTSGYLTYYVNTAVQIQGATVVGLNTWNHFALCRSGTSTRLFLNGVQQGGTYSDSNNYLMGGSRPIIGGNGFVPNGASQLTGYISNIRVVNGTALYTSAFTPPAAPLTAISGTVLLTCQGNRFRDASTNNVAVTKFGETSVSPFSPFNLPSPGYAPATYGGSGYFDGTSDGLTAPNNAAFNLSNGDFTLECWVYNTEVANSIRYAGIWGGGYILYREGTTYRFYYGGPGGSPLTPSIAAVAGAWTHLAVVRNGTTMTFYVNGVSGGSVNVSTTAISFSGQPFGIGANFETGSPGFPFRGYMSGARLVKGTAIYTAAFTPPTTPPTAVSGTSILCNFTNAGIFDASMNNNIETVGNAQVSTTQVKFGTTSAYFDGSGDVLNSPAGPQFNFGTGDFTVEFWMYKTSSTSFQRIVAYGGFTATGNFQVEAGNDTSLVIHINGAFVSTTVPNLLNSWVHVAVTRQSGSVRLFTNGTLRSTNTQAGSVGQTNPFSVGAIYDASSPYTGYIDDLRVTNGYARYTADFTPPGKALPIR